eukprot:CAMPEP_0206499926 /NCGR_PEP_ID=MMETSP0324_2-20121206/52061_1 /ASSEMBLY_ACC=CAM_ASM_000836 /TAXON_ID=2866 /ORGANISM="Crypthecodinium cohnii, Strain Seligo" /LENGTH=594 /DNA_ID=CAMNT_0053986759 /DNA_START=57 /DNA_END=1842 /DNA_ORIENTATION=-
MAIRALPPRVEGDARTPADQDFDRLDKWKNSVKADYEVMKKRSASRIRMISEEPAVVGYIWTCDCFEGLHQYIRNCFGRRTWRSANHNSSSDILLDADGNTPKGWARAEALRSREVKDRALVLQRSWAKKQDSVNIVVVNMAGRPTSLLVSPLATAGEVTEVLAHETGLESGEEPPTALEISLVHGETILNFDEVLPAEALEGEGPHFTMVRSRLRWVVSGSHDGTLGLWDLETEERIGYFPGHGDAILSLTVDWKSRRALSGSHDCRLKLWDLDHSACVGTILSKNHPAFCLAADWLGLRALSGSWDGELRLWDLHNFQLASRTRKGRQGNVLSVLLDNSVQECSALCGTSKGYVEIWSFQDASLLWSHQATPSKVTALASSAEAERLWAGCGDGYVVIYHLPNAAEEMPSLLASVAAHEGVVSGISLHPAGLEAVTVSWDATLRCWEPSETSDEKENNKGSNSKMVSCKAVLEHESREALTCLAVDWHAQCAVTGSTSAMRVWDLEVSDHGELIELKGHEDGVCTVAIAREVPNNSRRRFLHSSPGGWLGLKLEDGWLAPAVARALKAMVAGVPLCMECNVECWPLTPLSLV